MIRIFIPWDRENQLVLNEIENGIKSFYGNNQMPVQMSYISPLERIYPSFNSKVPDVNVKMSVKRLPRKIRKKHIFPEGNKYIEVHLKYLNSKIFPAFAREILHALTRVSQFVIVEDEMKLAKRL